MGQVVWERIGIRSDKNAFGALPIQRVSTEYAGMLLRKAYDAGITFFDSARGYSDSEEKIGLALADVREHIVIATKTHAQDVAGFWRDLETSLRLLRTDYIDIYQFHWPRTCPKPGDGSGLYEAMLEAKAQGKIRHIGISSHNLDTAREAVLSGLYDTLQFPFSYLSSQADRELAELCGEQGVGFIAMKALSGGLITKSDAAYAWLDQYPHVLPIWGIQRESELDEFIGYMKNPPTLTPALEAIIAKDREELAGNFCRGCGYCMPCPMEIQISTCARMAQLIRRSPSQNWLGERGRVMMDKIEDCIECGQCRSKCP
jgi:aryl-alcohol dehydrogenase-like predicted oxidoreductase